MKQPGRFGEAGAALVSVLLLVAVMSVAALAVSEVTSRSIHRTQLNDAQSQGLWFVAGAEEIGHVQIKTLQLTGGLELVLEHPALTQDYIYTSPIGGVLTARLRDASNCFNINSVVELDEFDEKTGNEDNIKLFRQILEVFGTTESEAESLSDALVDWIDEDSSRRSRGAEDSQYIRLRTPYRTSGQLLENISELRAIDGFTAELVSELEKVACANETIAPALFNINTLELDQAPLLVAAFSGELNLGQAVRVLEDRPLGGWQSVEDFLSHRDITSIPQEQRNDGLFSTTTGRLEVTGSAVFRGARQNFSVLYSVSTDQPLRTVRRSFGES